MSALLNYILENEEAFKSKGRLASLYSDFQQQATVNPDGYNANIQAWKKALASAARAGVLPSQGSSNNLLTITTGDDLARELQSKQFGRPMALGVVINDAIAKKELIPVKEFESSTTSIYYKGWSVSPFKVVGWGLRQLGVIGQTPGETLTAGNFVIVENVEYAASTVLQQIQSKQQSATDLIYSRDAFISEFSTALSSEPLSTSDIDILLTYLSRDKQAISHNSTTIKFKPASSTAPPEPITENDVTIAKLRTLIDSHNAQIPILTARIAGCDARAREAISNKLTVVARSALRSKKLAESTLERRTATLAQLEEVFSKIEAAASNVDIVRVMEASAVTLRDLNKQVGGAEGVEAVVDALRDEMDKVDEVTGIVNEVGADATIDEDVEEEFAALERAEREKREAAERAEKERKEKEEAEATRKRLEELENLEKERKAKEAARQKEEEQRQQENLQRKEQEERSVAEASEDASRQEVSTTKDADVAAPAEGLKRLSLEPSDEELSQKNENDARRELVPAS